jgi:putative ABC transport system permease protein
LPWQHREEQLGDLEEGFRRRRSADERAARRWYTRQVLRSMPAALRLRLRTTTDDQSPGRSMDSLTQDIRFAVRSLSKSPGFAVVSTVTLALAIGVNTSIFSIVNAIVFAELPMSDSETVALVRGVNPELGIDQGSVSPADFLDLGERQRSFESMTALTEAEWVLTGLDQPERISGLAVSAGIAETWRMPPVLGRSFAEGEDRWDAEKVVMLTHGFWQDRFGGRADALGETLTLDGQEYTVIGVSPPQLEFASFSRAQVLTPLVIRRNEPNRAARYLFVSGRLAPGVTQGMAEEEVRRIGADLAAEYPEQNRGWGLWSAPVMESMINEDGRKILLLLQLTVGMVILIACANVANMLLARATARGREIAVRAALGAGRRRLIRQLLTESLMISLASAAIGLGIAVALNKTLIWISAGMEVAFLMAEMDGRVLGFTLAVSLVAPIVFGLVPALRASGLSATDALRDRGSTDGGRSGKRMRSVLVGAQVSLALALMVVASLLTRTVAYLDARPLGFDPTDLLTIHIDLPEAEYEDEGAVEQFFTLARERIGAVAGFGPTALVSALPGAEFGALRSVEIEGYEQAPDRAAPTVLMSTVTSGYFGVVGLELQRGRDFGPTDDASSFPVAVVSRRVADQYWPGDAAVGRRFRVAGAEEWYEVIGVVSDVRSGTDTETPAENVYVAHAQDTRSEMYVVSRVTTELALVAGQIREAVWSVDVNQPVGQIRTLERAQYETRASNYALLTLFITFAAFALIMASVGIYGVMAYAVSQRKNEIGLRMALGAEAGAVRWMIVSQGAKILGGGIMVGLLAAFGLSRLVASLVAGISPTDPLTFVGVPLVLGTVALAANLIPARRATRMDPAATLRAD